jgi:hypothetical protein
LLSSDIRVRLIHSHWNRDPAFARSANPRLGVIAKELKGGQRWI